MSDLISRTEVIKAIDEREDVNGKVNAEDIRTDICLIQSRSDKGEWIEKEVSLDGDIAYECSKCGELFCLIDGTPADNLYNFCPNCGADMRGE